MHPQLAFQCDKSIVVTASGVFLDHTDMEVISLSALKEMS